MKRKKIYINRDSIYVGKLVRVNEIKRYGSSDTPISDKIGRLYVSDGSLIRNILLSIDNDRVMDLLYHCDDYPILNMTPDEQCLESDIVIPKVDWIGSLLEHLGFDEKLDFEEIQSIKDWVFTDEILEDFLVANKKLSLKEKRKIMVYRSLIEKYKEKVMMAIFDNRLFNLTITSNFFVAPARNLEPRLKEKTNKDYIKKY